MAAPDLLARPHHDGSSLYVDCLAPVLGQSVTVRLRVPDAYPVSEVHVRQLADGEPQFHAARIERRTRNETWWAATVVCRNPVTNYRFILRGGAAGYQWVNGTGVHDRDVPDAADFRLVTFPEPPRWSTAAVVYQVFPDRFARGSQAAPVAEIAPDWATPADWDAAVDLGPGCSQQLFGGDLDGVREHLDHLVDLGITVLYLTPFFPAGSNHRYDATTFDRVDPLLGGDAALDRLVQEAHAHGIRVIGDLTTNHTGDRHEWFVNARANPAAPERDYYFFDDDGGYASWLDVPSLPKLDHRSEALEQAMFDGPGAVTTRWLTRQEPLDGWRVDVANMTGRYQDIDDNHAVARRMRAAMVSAAPQALLVAEHGHDHSRDAVGDGWHGVMNYSGFTRPLWTWLRHKDFAPEFLGSPLMVPRLDGAAVADTMTEFGALVPWRSRTHSFNLVGSHDTTRIMTLVGDDSDAVRAAAAVLFTMPGIPMMTYGDEIGMRGSFGEDGRRPMPWGGAGWDTDVLETYRELISARRDDPALREGGFRWVATTNDTLVYVRETATRHTVVRVSRHGHEPLSIPTDYLSGIETGALRAGDGIELRDGQLRVSADRAGYGVWSWNTGGDDGQAG